MNHPFAVAQRVVGVLLMLFSATMLLPVLVALFYGDGEADAFLSGFGITLAAGFIAWWPARRIRKEIKLRDAFLVVVLFWAVLGLFGSLPLFLAERPDMTVTDAVFEGLSGLTTTGATVLTGLDTLPHAVLFWRQLLQWLGGMGIIVLAVAILPMLGIGGMQLYRAETPGPIKDSKLTPRIQETAKTLWYLYAGMTVVCALVYWFAGMTPFDAVGLAFSSIATGGFSTHDLSLGHHDDPVIELAAVFAMLVGSVNFALHFTAWRTADLRTYWRDAEARTFLTMVVGATTLVGAYLLYAGTYGDPAEAFIKALFQVVSIGTTTGFTTTDYTLWPAFLPMLLLLGSFVGGCGGSTTGGIKVVRFVLLLKQGLREVTRLIHPNAELPVKLGGRVMPPHVIEAVWGFFAAYIGVYVLMFLLLLLTGLDEVSAFSAVAACLNNLGPGLGEVSSNMASVTDPGKWLLCLAMLMGRLEIFTLLVIFSPAFWRR